MSVRLDRLSITRRYTGAGGGSTGPAGSVGPSTTTHSYWRVYNPVAVQGHGNWTLTELEFRDRYGGDNLAVGGTALSSGDFSGRPASNAFDNNQSTIWSSSASTPPMWIGYQFASPVAINEVVFRATTDTTFFDQTPLTCYIESSDDGSTWNPEWKHTQMDNATVNVLRMLRRPDTSRAYQSWRIRATAVQRGTIFGSNFALAELEFRASVGGASLCTGGTPMSSSDFSGFAKSQAYDANNSTAWASLNDPVTTTSPAWIGYRLATPSSVAEIRMVSRNDATFYTQAPKDWIVQCRDDLYEWADVKVVTGTTWSGAAQSQTFSFP